MKLLSKAGGNFPISIKKRFDFFFKVNYPVAF